MPMVIDLRVGSSAPTCKEKKAILLTAAIIYHSVTVHICYTATGYSVIANISKLCDLQFYIFFQTHLVRYIISASFRFSSQQFFVAIVTVVSED